MSEIIGYYLPDLIDLHNYSSANSLEHKKSNWRTLNKKVLTEFGLEIPDVIITGLSNGKPGLAEVLLFNLRLKIDEQLELQVKHSQHSTRHTSLSLLTSTSQKNSEKISQYTANKSSKFNEKITQLHYEEIKQQYLQQEEQIEVLQAKLHRLEHLLQLKDTRIDQLLGTLENDLNIKSHRSNK